MKNTRIFVLTELLIFMEEMFYVLDVYKMVAHDYSDEVITQCVTRVWERKSSLSQLTKRSASEFLISRTKRANTGWEETKEGHLEQECK